MPTCSRALKDVEERFLGIPGMHLGYLHKSSRL
jgi:hypothetical protein